MSQGVFVNDRKKALRREAKSRLKALTTQQIRAKSLKLSDNLHKILKKWDFQGVLGGFPPLPDEPLWHLSLTEYVNNAAFPDFSDNLDISRGMVYRKCKLNELNSSTLVRDLRKAPSSYPEVRPNIILVPGLGFSADGSRLGRGKGFFDQYLTNFSGVTIGLCFGEIIFDQIPVEVHDQKVDIIITDTRIYDCSENIDKIFEKIRGR